MTNLANYRQEELTLHAGKTELLGLFYPLPFVAIIVLMYYLVWGESSFISPYIYFKSFFGNMSSIILLAVIIVGIIVHEFIHGFTWAQFATEGLKSMKYGVIWKYLTPYCHCKEPLLVKHYITGGIMPAIILGFIPSIIAIIIGGYGLLLFGIFFTFAAGGDFIIVSMLLKQPASNLVQDHPTKVGCYVHRDV